MFISPQHLPPWMYKDAKVLWDFHHLGHRLEPCAVGIGMGSLDLEVATFTAALFKRRLFPLIVFTGATSNVTRDRFPRGEAVAYREKAIRHRVPSEAILLETRATNTEENIAFTRELLDQQGFAVSIRCCSYAGRPKSDARS